MAISFDALIKKYTGKIVDNDGVYPGQCMDLFHVYCKQVLGFKSPGAPAAADMWIKYSPKQFTRIPNTPTGVPKKGDVMIWKKGYGAYGHIAIVISGTTKNFTCFSQNDPIGSKCHLQPYPTYRYVLGWLHPKIASMAPIPVKPPAAIPKPPSLPGSPPVIEPSPVNTIIEWLTALVKKIFGR